MATSYRDLDYEAGKAIQILRSRIGLTQAALAEHLGVSTRTVNGWEAGGNYPRTEHLKKLIALAIQHQAFVPGHQAEEIRALWEVTRQKMLLDEHWLSTLLDKQVQEPDVAPALVPETANQTPVTTASPELEIKGKSDDALAMPLLHKHEDAKAPQTRGRNKRLVGIALILAITGVGAILLLQIRYTQSSSYPGYLSGNGQLAFFDPLSQESGSQWSSRSNDFGGVCQFNNGAYHISQQPNGYFAECFTRRIFSNFAFEVQLTITGGDCGGILFRRITQGQFYYFRICDNGAYRVSKNVDDIGSHAKILYFGSSSAIHKGLGHQNKITVVCDGSVMTFYVNEQLIDQEQDSSYTSGKIALIADPYLSGGHATDVAYSNARLWIL